MNKTKLINQLALEPHPIEGGYFCRTYTSNITCNAPTASDSRPIMSSIYYMLTDDSPMGYLHWNKSDIMHYFHLGSPTQYTVICPNGSLEQIVLGTDLDKGHQLQLLVKGGSWKASKLLSGELSLISEAVAPGFNYQDNRLATAQNLKNEFPQHWATIAEYIPQAK